MFQKILVAMDCSEMNKSVFDKALSLAETTGASCKLLHVLFVEEDAYPESLTSSLWSYGSSLKDLAFDSHNKRLKILEMKGLKLLRSHSLAAKAVGVQVESTQILGSPGRTICNAARSWDADLIIIGSRGLFGPSELRLGNVSNYVNRHAPCSVLVVHSQAKDEVKLSESSKVTAAEQVI
ncbi:MAG: universal stress protein [Leptolyngbyaceae cyanobacterium MO_188.B28]|nr:universal stress protein [Leptolyngbyaceae cyanobacterium MO_188.B28]